VFQKADPALAPDDHEGYSNLGTAYADGGRFDEALVVLNKALALYPQGDPDVFSNLGAVYHRLQRFNDALVHYEKALDFNPEDPDVHFNIAKCYLARGDSRDRPGAIDWLEKAARLYGPVYADKRARVLELLNSLTG
jgi:Flp pilus assembly protein TadD